MYNKALDVYEDLKASGLIRIIRNYGDNIFFGPVKDAIGNLLITTKLNAKHI